MLTSNNLQNKLSPLLIKEKIKGHHRDPLIVRGITSRGRLQRDQLVIEISNKLGMKTQRKRMVLNLQKYMLWNKQLRINL